MLTVIKYLVIGVVLTIIGFILIAILTTILDWIDSKLFQGFCIFMAISVFVGYMAFLATGDDTNKGYRYNIKYHGARYWTNEFTISGGAITFFDQNGDGNTIKSGYEIKDFYDQIQAKEDK